MQWREHDLLGRVLTVHEPDGNVRRFAYDGLDNVTWAQDRHAQVQYAYRGLGRLIRWVEAGTAVEFLHDTEEQLRAIVNEHGLAYRFELDGAGDVVTEAGFDGLTRRYQRDAGGRVVALELPTGQRTHYRYDPAGRVMQVQYGDGSTETYAYRADGGLLAARNETTTVTFTRDGQGQVLQEQQGVHTLSSEYDARGQRTRLRSSLGADVQYTHDKQGAVTQMQAGSWQALFERDAQGLEVQRTLSGGVHTRSERDSLGRLREQRISVGLGGRQSGRTRRYGWQAGDRLAQIRDSQYGLTQYEHDAVGNLAATTYGDGTRELRLPDAVGNLFTRADRQDRRYGPAGQVLDAQGTRYAYDALGNLSSKTTSQGQQWHYAWNAAGHLSEVVRPDGGIVRFTYDALGRRVSKSYQGRVTRWVWDGDKPLHEWTTLEVEAKNVDELVTWLFEEDSFTPAAKLTQQESYSVVADHLGTPLALYNAQGQATWEMSLDSYGQIRQGTGKAQDCPFRYQGQYEDQETGLYYNRFRYYDPETGQYISQDPIGLLGGSLLYGYVNDPTGEVDVSGLSSYALGKSMMKAVNSNMHGGLVTAANKATEWQAHHLIPEVFIPTINADYPLSVFVSFDYEQRGNNIALPREFVINDMQQVNKVKQGFCQVLLHKTGLLPVAAPSPNYLPLPKCTIDKSPFSLQELKEETTMPGSGLDISKFGGIPGWLQDDISLGPKFNYLLQVNEYDIRLLSPEHEGLFRGGLGYVYLNISIRKTGRN